MEARCVHDFKAKIDKDMEKGPHVCKLISRKLQLGKYIHTYTYIHTYIYTYIHTYIPGAYIQGVLGVCRTSSARERNA